MKNLFDSIASSILIVIGCSVFLSSNNYVGAILFSIALYTICIKGYSLYTGKIGFVIDNPDIKDLILTLLINSVAAILFGYLISYAIPNLSESAKFICNNKLLNQNLLQTFIRSTMCGILMYIAVSTYKEQKSLLNIFLAVPVFILAGFEHSIANIGYFSIANIVSFDSIIFIIICILGNTFGAIILPLFKKVGR